MKYRSPRRQAKRSMSRRGYRAHWQPSPNALVRALAACSLLTFWSGAAEVRAQVLPSGMTTVAGQVTARTVDGTLTVNNSPSAIINWNSFSIGARNAVRFEQANASSQVLNRVIGNDPSAILGGLSSNGRVWLLNPNGVLFGQGARVDVAGLVTSSLNLNNADWLSGNHRFVQGTGIPGSIVNQGELRSTLGGQIALIGASVRNEGGISAPGGQVVLAAGSSVELVDSMTPNVSVKVNAVAGEVVNLGRLVADSGRIDVHAGTVNQSGIVRANSLSAGPGGEIVLQAEQRLTLGAGSETSATGASGHGGQVQLLGREVGLLDSARVDASGGSGGGQVLVGGGLQGKDPTVPNAQAVYFGPQASIVADATAAGDGGRVILWSDKSTRAFGSLSVRGGVLGGDGGFIETSGGWLDARPAKVDTAAPRGRSGTWLLDPYDITISDVASNTGFDPNFTANASGSSINSATIASALASGNVTISTGGANGGVEAGHITLNAANISVGVAAARSLTLNADGAIEATDSSIQSTLGPLNVNFNAALSGPGGIKLYNTALKTGTGGGGYGNIVLGGAAPGTTPNGASFGGAGGAVDRGVLLASGSSLNAGAGDVTLAGVSSVADGLGVWIRDGSSVAGATVAITGDSPLFRGVEVGFNGAGSVTATRAINVLGRGGELGVALFGPAVLTLSPTAFNATAQLLVRGQGIGSGDGVQARFTPALTPTISVANGANLIIEGTAEPGFYGVNLFRNAGIAATNDIDASGGTDMRLRTFGTGDLQIADSRILGAPGVNAIDSNRVAFSNAVLTMPGSVTVNASAVSLNATDITVGAGVSGPRSLTVNADSSIGMFGNSSIASGGGPLDVTFTAARSTDGGISLDNSSVTTGTVSGGFGNLSLGGPVLGANPTGTTFTGAGGAVTAGVQIGSSTLHAGTGDLSISGVSSLSVGHGVWIAGTSSLTGSNVSITGDAPLFRGIAFVTGSIDATHSIRMLGRGADLGVGVFGPSRLSLVPGSPDATAQMLVQGRVLDAGPVGVYVNFSPVATSGITVANGAGLTVEGATPSSGQIGVWLNRTDGNGPTIDADGASSMTVRTFGPGQIRIAASNIVGASGSNTLSADQVVLSDAHLTAAGTIAVKASSVYLQGTTELASSAAGDAIVVSGNNAPLQTFSNTAGSSALTVFNPNEGPPSGRWIVYATSITDTVNFVRGGLVSDFTRHNAAYGAWAGDAGSGLVFSVPQFATVTGTVQTKTYDGTTAATVTNLAATGLSQDSAVGAPSITGATFATSNASTNNDVTLSGLSFQFVDANQKPVYGYTPTYLLRGGITAAPITVAVSSVDKLYDATTSASPVATITSGLVGSQTLGVTSFAEFPVKDVGTYPVSVDIGLVDGSNGGIASNYSVAPTLAVSASITPASLTLATINVGKVYDGGLGALGTATVIGGQLFGSDSLSGGSFAFTNKNVGSGKTVTTSGVTVNDGNSGGNYTVSYANNTNSSITAASLTLGTIDVTKAFDGGLTALGTATVTGGQLFSGDSLTGGSFTFTNKNVGSGNKTVTTSGVTVNDGNSGSNYTVSYANNTTSTITPAFLTLGTIDVTKVYDGGLGALGTATVTGGQLFGSDSLAGGSFAYTDKNVGSGNKTVTASGVTVNDGNSGGNYLVSYANNTSSSITPLSLSVNGLSVNNKVYDASTDATLASAGSVSALGADVVTLGGSALASFVDKNVGTGQNVLVSGLGLSGFDAGNYRLATSLTATADITPYALTITGLTANNKVYDATTAATFGGSASVAALLSDVVTLGGTPLANFSTKNVGTGINVAVSGYTLGGADAGNYRIIPTLLLSADITPATLRYVAAPVTQIAGLALPPLTGAVDGFVGGESATTATSGTLAFTTPTTSASAAGRYAVLGSGLSAANYSFVQDPANATALTLNLFTPDVTATPPLLAKPGIEGAPKKALDLMGRPPEGADPGMGGVVDLVPSAAPPTRPRSPVPAGATQAIVDARSASTLFDPVSLSDMSNDAVLGMLEARAQYMQILFADAIDALEKDPTLADMPPCKTRADLLAGGCVVTDALKRELRAQAKSASVAIAPVAAAAPPSPAAAAISPAAAAPAAPAPVTNPPATLLASSARRVLNASLPQIHRKLALVIGIDRYEDPSIPQLANAVGDARAIGKVLESHMGYETVVLENATKKSVVSALNQLALELGPTDSVIFYYAGHGELVEATKLGYWQLADSDPKRPETWLSNADIGRMVAQFEASQVALVSDSCYSGSLVTDQRIRAATGTVDAAQMLSRKSVVVMSSGGNEPVADAGKQGHSPFAWNLMHNLRQLSSWQPGGNVFERVRFAVAKELPQRPQYGAFTAAGHQGSGDYLFEQRQLEPGAQ